MLRDSDYDERAADVLRPSEFSRQLLNTLDASEGRRQRRKRDTTPDAYGMQLKRALLERAVAEDPDPQDFEGWLLQQALSDPASGPVRGMCGAVLDEYRFACLDPKFAEWLAAGAPSADK